MTVLPGGGSSTGRIGGQVTLTEWSRGFDLLDWPRATSTETKVRPCGCLRGNWSSSWSGATKGWMGNAFQVEMIAPGMSQAFLRLRSAANDVWTPPGSRGDSAVFSIRWAAA
ncbi:MAG: hypothetical protein CMJ23_08280 [Phycisphaerae bacterium]|nr:hypothetical protein [Phycisphaerae bacterium]